MKPNESLLIFRDQAMQFYKMYEKIFLAMAKFMGTIYMLIEINNTIGYTPVLTRSYVIGALACVSALLPVQFMMIMAMIIIVTHLLSFNLLIGMGMFMICLCLYIFFIRLYPKESLMIVVTILAFKLNLHYAVAIIGGLFGGFSVSVGILIGIVAVFSMQSIAPIVQATVQAKEPLSMFVGSLNVFMAQVVQNPTMLATMSVLLIVFCVVLVIRKQMLDYAPYIAIIIGGAMNILGFVMAILFLKLPINVLLLVVMSIISVFLASIIQFMSKPLDYSRSETVQFEDEDNYYFVKVVPKVKAQKEYSKVEKVYAGHHKSEAIEIEE
ncbi:MAG: hypothetical protein RR090_10960 [Niameybacter sp.]|uniref:hypothetical protein n=1 Tax=Niameybacter sp. TaxID=2033640 RepID=UPI002FC79DE7